ncbi:hypothetical protein [Rhodohalobacter sp. 8-1]|uniref:hypothetical protein n=1 Tax=Rhodohalobacter sp. 8-1 TaxID=3131972 RepID=UPI0030EBC7DC
MSIPKTISIDTLPEKFEGAKTVINEYGSLDTDTVIFKLNPETWSCVEVCQHLIRFNTLYCEQMDKAVDSFSTIPVNGESFSPKWMSRKIASFLEPPYKFGVKTFKPMFPSTVDLNPAETFHKLIEIQDNIIDFLGNAKSERWNLDKVCASHPMIKIYKMSLTDFLIIIDAHQRRHFWQIEQILKRIPD